MLDICEFNESENSNTMVSGNIPKSTDQLYSLFVDQLGFN